MERRLAAILAADVVGYSRLMGKDEAGTLGAIKACREELIDPKIVEYHGRIVKLMGDGILLEFPSVVEAVQCAVDVQRAMGERNAEIPKDRQLVFRVGINLGDIIFEDEDIYGEGVIVAARLEGLAEPGGICISDDAYRQIETKLAFGYEDLGKREVKNIEKPVRVYRVLLDPEATGTVVATKKAVLKPWYWAAAAAVAVLVVAGAAIWHVYLRGPAPLTAVASEADMAFPLPDKPSIAVLPFDNMSDDTSQEYFADGMTEDLITDLAKIEGLVVISRNSTFTYKNKPVKVKQVAEELGVRYVLEGSVRRSGDKVRINAQLIDAINGGHIWAERYDGTLNDVFALQDKITGNVIRALTISLTARDRDLLGRKGARSSEAYENFLLGKAHVARWKPEDFARAVPYLERAVELDPNYGEALAELAYVYREVYANNFQGALHITQGEAYKLSKRYMEMALQHPTTMAYWVSASLAYTSGDMEKAIEEAEKAISLGPTDTRAYQIMAKALIYSGRPAEALKQLDKIARLDPQEETTYMWRRGQALFSLERYEDAIKVMKPTLALWPDDIATYWILAAAYAHLNQLENTKEYIAWLESPENVGVWGTSVSDVVGWSYKRTEDTNRFRVGMRKAGLQEVAFGFEDKLEEKITGEELRSLFYGQKLRATDPESGEKTWYIITQDGEATNDGPPGWGSGDAWIDEDENFCVFWETIGRICGPTFRNPKGTKEENNEYIYVYYHGPMPFSPVD